MVLKDELKSKYDPQSWDQNTYGSLSVDVPPETGPVTMLE